jgi:hypothetical protein
LLLLLISRTACMLDNTTEVEIMAAAGNLVLNYTFIEGFRVNTQLLHCHASNKLFVADRTSASGQRYFKCRKVDSEKCQSRGVLSNDVVSVTFKVF